MKKILQTLFPVVFCLSFGFSQPNLMHEAPQNNLSTTQLRAPNGLSTSAYMRASALVLQNELTYIPSGSTVTVFGFTLSNSTSVSTPVAGNFTLFIENTADLTYLKGTSWSGIVSSMTTCYASFMTIPQAASTTSVVVTLSTPFVYTGGGLYVAYDWFTSGPFSTVPATYYSESVVLTTGGTSAVSNISAPTTLATTNFRPSFLFGITGNPYSNDVKVSVVEAPGRIPAILNAPHTIRALVRNNSNTTLNSFSVNLNVTGANLFTNTQVISSLASGAATLVSFAPFNPLLPGAQTLSVSVGNDQFNANNSATYPQLVTCDTWGQNPGSAASTYTSNSVGFANGAGMIATPYLSPVNSTLVGLQAAVSTNTGNPGNTVYGVLMNSGGTILATTNMVVLTTAMQGNFLNLTFPIPVSLASGTTYYLGFAQTANVSVAYYPAASIATGYLPPSLYFSTGLGGGFLSPILPNFGYFGLHAVFAHTVTISASPQTVACGLPATLNAVSSTNYSWSTGATTSSITIPSATITTGYSVIATNTMGCMASANASVIVTPLQVGATFTPNVVCSGAGVALNATGATNYTWVTPSGTLLSNGINDVPVSTTNYTLTGSNPSGCATTTVITVFVNPLPNVNISSSSPSICLGNTISLTASGNSTAYAWSTGSTTANMIDSPGSTTIYTVTGTSALGCMRSNTISITVNSFTPGVTSPTAICIGESISLVATGASTLQWSNGSIFTPMQVTPIVTTVYTLTAKGLNGCQGTNATTVTVNPTPTILTVSTRTAICKAETVTITATGASTYSWSTGATTNSVVLTFSSTAANNFVVTGVSAAGCSSFTQVSVKVSQCTGLAELANLGGVKLFPNPSNGKITVSITSFDQSEILVYSALGSQLSHDSAVSENTVVDLSVYPKGIYFVTVVFKDKSTETIKIVRE